MPRGTLHAYLNGQILPEPEAHISPFDRGFLWGDGVYEVTPCFNRRLFRLADHMDRLFRSLRYVRIDSGMSQTDMERVTCELLKFNHEVLEPVSVYKVGHWVTRGIESESGAARDAGPATVCILFRSVRVETLARGYAEGVRLTMVPTRRVHPQCIEPRAKVTSKMNQILAEIDADASGALSLMLDIHGNIAENSTANFFMVRDGALWTAPESNILEGITRKVVFELADRLSIPWVERNFTAYDLAQADEFFVTSSSMGAMPVREVDRFHPKAPVPGPITRRLIEAFADETGFDFLGSAETPAGP